MNKASLAFVIALSTSTGVGASPKSVGQSEPVQQTAPAAVTPEGWSGEFPSLRADVEKRGTLVVHVLVALCDNAQIDCGSTKAGEPENLEHNLYWGAIFGHKRYFSRKNSGYEQVTSASVDGDRLERVVFRKRASGAPWGRPKEAPIELLVVLDAFRGDAIDGVVDRLFREAEQGATLAFTDGDRERTERVHVVGYAGHNRMMDGKQAPPPSKGKGAPIPSFIMACESASYFSPPLSARGSFPLVMTRALMAPEGYVVEAIVSALADDASRKETRRRTVAKYAEWQRITDKVAGGIFAPSE